MSVQNSETTKLSRSFHWKVDKTLLKFFKNAPIGKKFRSEDYSFATPIGDFKFAILVYPNGNQQSGVFKMFVNIFEHPSNVSRIQHKIVFSIPQLGWNDAGLSHTEYPKFSRGPSTGKCPQFQRIAKLRGLTICLRLQIFSIIDSNQTIIYPIQNESAIVGTVPTLKMKSSKPLLATNVPPKKGSSIRRGIRGLFIAAKRYKESGTKDSIENKQIVATIFQRLSLLEIKVDTMVGSNGYTNEECSAIFDNRKAKLEKVKQWLCIQMCLPEYVRTFIQNGFDDLQYFKQLSDNDLLAIGIVKKGHRMKLLKGIQLL